MGEGLVLPPSINRLAMKKLFSIVGLAGFFVLLASFGQRGIESNGAPIASTGAPMEHTCAKSNCHAGSDVNMGQATLSIDYNNGIAHYVPGQTYTVTVSLSQPGIERFGFQMVALADGDSSNAGSFIPTDSNRTQVLTGVNEFTGRNYMTYKYEGTNPYAAGLGQWSFKWMAPATDIGPVTFYAAAVAANNDATDNGDTVYTKQMTLNANPTGIATIDGHVGMTMYPNPAYRQLYVQYQFANAGNTTIRLMDMAGKQTTVSLSRQDDASLHDAELDIAGLSAGIYLLVVNHGQQSVAKKVVIE